MAYDENNNIIKQIDEEKNAVVSIYDEIKTNLIKKAIYKKKAEDINVLELTVFYTADFKISEYMYYSESERIANGYLVKGLLKSKKTQWAILQVILTRHRRE